MQYENKIVQPHIFEQIILNTESTVFIILLALFTHIIGNISEFIADFFTLSEVYKTRILTANRVVQLLQWTLPVNYVTLLPHHDRLYSTEQTFPMIYKGFSKNCYGSLKRCNLYYTIMQIVCTYLYCRKKYFVSSFYDCSHKSFRD